MKHNVDKETLAEILNTIEDTIHEVEYLKVVLLTLKNTVEKLQNKSVKTKGRSK